MRINILFLIFLSVLVSKIAYSNSYLIEVVPLENRVKDCNSIFTGSFLKVEKMPSPTAKMDHILYLAVKKVFKGALHKTIAVYYKEPDTAAPWTKNTLGGLSFSGGGDYLFCTEKVDGNDFTSRELRPYSVSHDDVKKEIEKLPELLKKFGPFPAPILLDDEKTK
jgi:hypothetical protein